MKNWQFLILVRLATFFLRIYAISHHMFWSAQDATDAASIEVDARAFSERDGTNPPPST